MGEPVRLRKGPSCGQYVCGHLPFTSARYYCCCAVHLPTVLNAVRTTHIDDVVSSSLLNRNCTHRLALYSTPQLALRLPRPSSSRCSLLSLAPLSHDWYAANSQPVLRVEWLRRRRPTHNLLSLSSYVRLSDYRSPATTTNHYAKDDPTAVSVGTTSNLATLGHPADGVVINEDLNARHTRHEVATTTTTSTAAQQQPMATTSAARHTMPSGANGDGLVLASNIGGPMGGSVVMGGQCECTRNGGTCGHGAGQCSCRGCTTAATSINPGINIGVSTHQYTAPVGTSGIGGGVADPGVGMAGVVNTTNPDRPAGQCGDMQNCDCVRKAGVCNCAAGPVQLHQLHRTPQVAGRHPGHH